jgi:hypothetical protein
MIDITDYGDSIEVTFEDDHGNRASAVVVGDSLDSVRERSEEIVETHNLRERAKDTL